METNITVETIREMQARVAEAEQRALDAEAEVAILNKQLSESRANDKCAMGYLSQIRHATGQDVYFPTLVEIIRARFSGSAIADAVAAEREACAKICEDYINRIDDLYDSPKYVAALAGRIAGANRCLKAIRDRGLPPQALAIPPTPEEAKALAKLIEESGPMSGPLVTVDPVVTENWQAFNALPVASTYRTPSLIDQAADTQGDE